MGITPKVGDPVLAWDVSSLGVVFQVHKEMVEIDWPATPKWKAQKEWVLHERMRMSHCGKLWIWA